MDTVKEADKIEVERRLRQVEDWIIKGLSIRKMVENGIKEWGIKQAQIYRYVNRIFEQWKEENNEISADNYNKAIKRREFIYNKAVEEKDWLLALKTEKDIRELQGLYTKNVKISGDKESPIHIYLPDDGRNPVNEKDMVEDPKNNIEDLDPNPNIDLSKEPENE
jgi:hypothetical protein